MNKFCAVEKESRAGKAVCDNTRSSLLQRLQDIQKKKGYVSDKDMQVLADEMGIHPVEVYSVVTFYSFLTSKKTGKHVIRISNCVPNVMGGSEKILKEFCKELKIEPGQTTKDNGITVERTSCIGMCDQAPAIMVDDELVGNVTPKKVKDIIKTLKKK